jgi:signal transduction histidine kinase
LDITRVVQAVAALVENSALHGASDRAIEVVGDAADDAIRITVRDHGAGFDPARAGELFQPFSRLGSKAKGAGLGLYLARAIARAHGGDAFAEAAEGGGARFVLTFPR